MKQFNSKDFADEPVINLMSRLVTLPNNPCRKNGIELEKLKLMTADEIRTEFAERLNDGRLTFSTYTHKHLEKKLND
tara:strand:- start:43 stop:273 length:231 start_codon:yes stop_codon:yes gene_type:complete